MSGVFFDVSLTLFAGYFCDIAEVFVNELLEKLSGGKVFLHYRNLVAGNVFGDIAPVLAVLEIVIRLAVRAGADDGEVAVLHAGDFGHLSDAFGDFFVIHEGEYMKSHILRNPKREPTSRFAQVLGKFVLRPAGVRRENEGGGESDESLPQRIPGVGQMNEPI